MESAIYTGRVRHRRHSPETHRFSYRVFMAWLDLDEIPAIFNQSRLWSSTGPAPIRFRREDFFGETEKPLKQAVTDWVFEQTGTQLKGPVRLLANLRCAGFIINPIVCYYCYSENAERLEYVIAEVTNTPWGERRRYLMPCNGLDTQHGRTASGEFSKSLHVSPFQPMELLYKWRLDRPASRLNLHFDIFHSEKKVFDATLMFEREPLNSQSMRAILWRFPFMTVKVFAAIYWQAIRLWLKGMPFYSNPNSRHRAT